MPLPLIALWFACPAPEPADPAPPDDTGTPPVDADGDGADAGHDCDDADPAVFPGATPACGGGTDDDCDGAVDPIDADRDGDGVSVCAADCDDADPAVLPGVPEGCDGVDADCDGVVDDLQPGAWTCGWCADPADYATSAYQILQVPPCGIDPTATLDCAGSHQVVMRTDVPLRPLLVLFLPPGQGNRTDHLLGWLAHSGYPVIQVAYPDRVEDGACVDGAQDPTCGGLAHEELLHGEDRSPNIEIPFQDSIVGRVGTLLGALDVEQPAVGWGRFLVDGAPDWPSIVVVGWSDGGVMAAMAARDLPVHAAVLISAPAADGDGSVLLPWMEVPFVTPGDQIWGVRHEHEASAQFMDAAWDRWAIPGPNLLFDAGPPPFASHRLTSDLPGIGDDCTGHNAVASDSCMDLQHVELYVPLMCEIGRVGPG